MSREQLANDKLSKITNAEWEEIYARLVYFVDNKLRQCYFRVSQEAADIALGAIEKTLSGSRRWNYENYSIMEHLCGVARSEIYNLYSSHDNAHTRSLNIDDEHEKNIASNEVNTIEDIYIAKDMIDKFIEAISKKDPILREYAYLRLVEGENAAPQCAQKLSVSVEEIYRLARRLTELANQFGANANRDRETAQGSGVGSGVVPFRRKREKLQ